MNRCIICAAPLLPVPSIRIYSITEPEPALLRATAAAAAAVINNQIEMPSITWNVCLMKRAGGLKKRKLQCFQRGDRHKVFFCQSGEVSIRVG